MTLLEVLFHGSALSVLPFWGAMLLFPNAERTKRLVSSPWIIASPVLCYLAILLPELPAALAVFARPSPESLRTMTGQPWGASLFWTYAGAFDLFVGRWMFLDARERGVPHFVLAPALFVAIFFGPLGLSLYAAGSVMAPKKASVS